MHMKALLGPMHARCQHRSPACVISIVFVYATRANVPWGDITMCTYVWGLTITYWLLGAPVGLFLLIATCTSVCIVVGMHGGVSI